MKEVLIITESVAAGEHYKRLLCDLFEEAIQARNICTDRDGLTNLPDAELYVVGATSTGIFGQIIAQINPEKKIVVVSLTFKKQQIDQLKAIPAGTQAMLVNFSANMTIETIAELNWLGVTHIELVPVHPGLSITYGIDAAITPGEPQFVPHYAKNVLDIGHRVFNAETITEVALKLGYTWFLKSEKYREYINSLIKPRDSVSMLWMESMRMENYFRILIGALDIGIVGIDTENCVFTANAAAQAIIGVRIEDLIGKPLLDTAVEIGQAVQEDQAEKIAKLLQIRGVHITLSTAPIIWQGDLVGRFILLQRFTEEEKRQHQFRLQLYQKGYKSKYTFNDIIGKSPGIVRAKSIARKMAGTDSSVLLTGESGTGKELFAHSIHHASKRSDMPFVAINCAALPENLLESELFGYAEGAFTGAKKGGKLGLFEYAHKGTLFLDEIEGMSPNLQIKLLRVLQEREMTRVGDDRIISIDVRIIAASNENILDMVHRGMFRRDLYYRLNTLPISIPPLREREEDIFLIMGALRDKLGANFQLTPAAQNVFRGYAWEGNVRELNNIVEYLRFEEKPTIDVADLPLIMTADVSDLPPPDRGLDTKMGIKPDAKTGAGSGTRRDIEGLAGFWAAARGREEAFSFVLRALGEAADSIGRGSLLQTARERGMTLTEQEIRGILVELNKLGMVSVSKGRGGSRLTLKGKSMIEYL
ncbi:MAG: sigma 54-interacting transcriptional regulator [Peptococcaceae bacterium]|jgi:transcriptional regulator with PAS, ATPase and Fis domain|nr:sigma 54-interacting transcriptional regulator [Peptococcaceae bacterium]